MAFDAEEARRARYREVIQTFCLLDDVFMTAVFQDSLPCVDLVLQIILNRPNLHATRVVTQDTMKNLQGHDVRLDIHAFADGQEFNIEIQRASQGAAPRRARYHSSIMDANALAERTAYEKLPESYVIFITETDVLGCGQPLYLIRRIIEGIQKPFEDGSHIVYVNSAVMDTSTPLGQLMHDFHCTRPEDMYYEVLAERTGYFKNYEGGATKMNAALETLFREMAATEIAAAKEKAFSEGVERGMERGMERGTERAYLSSIRKMMENFKLTAENAMDVLAIPKSEWGHYKALL